MEKKSQLEVQVFRVGERLRISKISYFRSVKNLKFEICHGLQISDFKLQTILTRIIFLIYPPAPAACTSSPHTCGSKAL
jgi:hypothetical protein